jgi:nucleotide-binding universal stress UspA family protein
MKKEERKRAGQSILDEARKFLDELNCEINEELPEGPEAEAILSVAEIQKIGLILMGTRGLGSLEGMLLGSVSREVTHHSFSSPFASVHLVFNQSAVKPACLDRFFP